LSLKGFMEEAYGGQVRSRRLERRKGTVVLSLKEISDKLESRPEKVDVARLAPKGALLARLISLVPEGKREALIWGYLTSIAAEGSLEPVEVTGGDYAGLELARGRLFIDGAGDHIGEGMKGGLIRVRGRSGHYLGQGMSGGGIVAGSSGDYAFRNISGGWGVILGDSGSYLGLGNSGGRVVVKGRAGQRVGWLMHSGRLRVGGDVGDYLGLMMSGGRISVGGCAGARAGWRMRGGKIEAACYGPEACGDGRILGGEDS